MRLPFLAVTLLACAIAPIADAAPKPAPKAPQPTEAPAVATQRAKVEKLARTQLTPAYPEALVELGRRQREAQALKAAYATMMQAAEAFDKQVELHKGLSETISPFELARAERTAARRLAMQRDEAFFTAAEIARASGDTDAAIRHYVTVVQSQPEQPLGAQALTALTTLGFVVPPPPSPSASPSTSPAPARSAKP